MTSNETTLADLTDQQRESLEAVRVACVAAVDTRVAAEEALTARDQALAEHWPVLSNLTGGPGSTFVARAIGENIITDGTVRGLTRTVQARLRCKARAND